jgi:hypothetical protein
MQPGLLIEVLTREPQIHRRQLTVTVRVLFREAVAKRLALPAPGNGGAGVGA